MTLGTDRVSQPLTSTARGTPERTLVAEARFVDGPPNDSSAPPGHRERRREAAPPSLPQRHPVGEERLGSAAGSGRVRAFALD